MSNTSQCNGQNCHPAPDMLVMHPLCSRILANAGPAGSYDDIKPIDHMGKPVYSAPGAVQDLGYLHS